MTRPTPTTLACLIVAEAQQRRYAEGTFDDPVYEVLDKAVSLSDDAKADLYARMAERVTPGMVTRFIELEHVIARALRENRQAHPNG